MFYLVTFFLIFFHFFSYFFLGGGMDDLLSHIFGGFGGGMFGKSIF